MPFDFLFVKNGSCFKERSFKFFFIDCYRICHHLKVFLDLDSARRPIVEGFSWFLLKKKRIPKNHRCGGSSGGGNGLTLGSIVQVLEDAKRGKKFKNDYLNITPEEEALGFKYVYQTLLTKETMVERIRAPFEMWSQQETFIDSNVQLVLDRFAEYYEDDEDF